MEKNEIENKYKKCNLNGDDMQENCENRECAYWNVYHDFYCSYWGIKGDEEDYE